MKLVYALLLGFTVYSVAKLSSAESSSEPVFENRVVTLVDFYPTQKQIPPARWKVKINDNGKVVDSHILCKWLRIPDDKMKIPNGTTIVLKYDKVNQKYSFGGCENFLKKTNV